MVSKWFQRAIARAAGLGLTLADLNRAVGGKSTIMQDHQKKGTSPSIDNFAKIAKRLSMTVGELYDGETTVPETLAVTGFVKGGEMWQAFAKNQQKQVPLSFFDTDLVVLEIETGELMPAYRIGDVLAGTKMLGRNLDNLIGKDCIVETAKGERYVKYLARGPASGTLSLRSFNPAEPDILGVKLAWAAPIQMVLRANS